MNSKTRNIVFIFFAILAFAAMLYHTVGTIQPFDATPAWRHTLFIGICSISIYGLLKRPKWFVLFFGILTIQQLYSHGSHFVKLMQEDKINFIDIAVILLTPLLFILLLIDKKIKQ
jgi:fumarate reductase subunit C